MATTLRRKFSVNIGVSATQVGAYTAPSVTTGVFLTGLCICNVSGSSITVSADIFDGSTHAHLIVNATVPVGGAINLADYGNRIILNSGDQVFVTSSAVTSADAILSIEEIQ
jgi:hypothetical protein